MKVSYKSLLKSINKNISLDELSEKLFQLGHEHEVVGNIIDFELTPNRGDCLSEKGLLRDLRIFYDTEFDKEIYKKNIDEYELSFINNARELCPKASFLFVEIDTIPEIYNESLENYFSTLQVKKNNFFTDISNYISYETGQPTHCYDSSTVGNYIKLDIVEDSHKFESLLDKTIELSGTNLAFFNKDNELINLAGIVGSKNTSCKENTKAVLIECAYFKPETILGKSIKYGINSEAAHKFERNVDPSCHEYVLRRFLKIVEEHTNILNVSLYKDNHIDLIKNKIRFDADRINKILGINIPSNKMIDYLMSLGFEFDDLFINIPFHRHDIKSINDIAEEIARSIGYDNIESNKFFLDINKNLSLDQTIELKIKNLLINNGFYEVINDPFTKNKNELSIEVDNPLDSNRKFLRTSLKESLVENLLYNERRQKDSVKLFEVADIYTKELNKNSRFFGIIASGRVDKNYVDFTKKIDISYLRNILNNHIEPSSFNIVNIERSSINSKLKSPIVYIEFRIDESFEVNYSKILEHKKPDYYYEPISEFPSSFRDLSFSVKDPSSFIKLQEYILNYEDDLLKDVYVFDYFLNEKNEEIKIGFRFTFQCNKSTITENQVNNVMDAIINRTLKFKDVTIPGME